MATGRSIDAMYVSLTINTCVLIYYRRFALLATGSSIDAMYDNYLWRTQARTLIYSKINESLLKIDISISNVQ